MSEPIRITYREAVKQAIRAAPGSSRSRHPPRPPLSHDAGMTSGFER